MGAACSSSSSAAALKEDDKRSGGGSRSKADARWTENSMAVVGLGVSQRLGELTEHSVQGHRRPPQFLRAASAEGGLVMVVLAETRRLEDVVLVYRGWKMVGGFLLERPEEIDSDGASADSKTLAERLELKANERWDYHRLLKLTDDDLFVVCGSLKRYRAEDGLWSSTGRYHMWVCSADREDFGRLVASESLKGWEALKGHTYLRGPGGEVYNAVAASGGTGLEIMKLGLDSGYIFEKVMSVSVPGSSRISDAVPDDAVSNVVGSESAAFVSAVGVSATHVLWRAWGRSVGATGDEEEFYCDELQNSGDPRVSAVSWGPQWRSGARKRSTAAAALVGDAVVYIRCVPREKSFAVEIARPEQESKSFGFDVPRRAAPGSVRSVISADVHSRGCVLNGVAAFCFRISHADRAVGLNSSINGATPPGEQTSHLLVLVDAERAALSCPPVVVGADFPAVKNLNLMTPSLMIMSAERVDGSRTCLVARADEDPVVRDLGADLAARGHFDPAEDEVDFNLEDAPPRTDAWGDLRLWFSVWTGAAKEGTTRWDQWRECPEIHSVTPNSNSLQEDLHIVS